MSRRAKVKALKAERKYRPGVNLGVQLWPYVVTLKHDKGLIKIKTFARNAAQAKENILRSENAPPSSIKSVKRFLKSSQLKGAPSMAKRKHKRKMSAAQKAALAKGRAALKKRRYHKARKVSSRRHVSPKMEPIIIREGGLSMARKRHHKKRHYSGGFEGKRKHYRKRRYHGIGGMLAGGRLDLMGTAQDVGGLAAGAVGSSFVAKMVPVKDARIQAIIPIVLSIVIGMTKLGRSRIMKAAATGALAVGTLSLVKQFFPTLPLLSGAEDAESVAGAIDALPVEERAMLGLAVEGSPDADFQEGEAGDAISEVETYGVMDAPLSPASI
jgi:hypothetical protein